mmetsp:Transcript_67729/g.218834  ORF Transcript_67729/g.218834 Transcript_67729/m.218834 type:complete len:226 (+) Transcript_67729:2591-3268(+)
MRRHSVVSSPALRQTTKSRLDLCESMAQPSGRFSTTTPLMPAYSPMSWSEPMCLPSYRVRPDLSTTATFDALVPMAHLPCRSSSLSPAPPLKSRDVPGTVPSDRSWRPWGGSRPQPLAEAPAPTVPLPSDCDVPGITELRGKPPACRLPQGPPPKGALPEAPLLADRLLKNGPPGGALPRGALPRGALPSGPLPRAPLPNGPLPNGPLPSGPLARSPLHPEAPPA